MGPWTGKAEAWIEDALSSLRSGTPFENRNTKDGVTGCDDSGSGSGSGSAIGVPVPPALPVPVGGERCHSVVLRPSVPVEPPCALFVDYEADEEAEASVEATQCQGVTSVIMGPRSI